MIYVNNLHSLNYNKKEYKCSVGLNGFTKNKIEGDKKTPSGTYGFGNLFVRTDRIPDLNTKFKIINIQKEMAWSDDPTKSSYNKLIKINYNHKESLYRKDNKYDLLLVINYNIDPIIPHKGSAIFMHLTTDSYEATAGCVALKLNDFTEILKTLNPNDKITIV